MTSARTIRCLSLGEIEPGWISGNLRQVRLAEEEPGEVSAQGDAVRRAQRIAELPVAAKKIVWLASCRREEGP